MDIGLEPSELSKVIYQEISSVHPDYRGNGLQKLLGRFIMDELNKNNHSYRYVCCTVAPFNIPSLKDKFVQGMQIAALKEKYGNLLRYVFVKDLKEERTKMHDHMIRINMADIQLQQEKLAAGWRGLKMEAAEGEIWIHYGFMEFNRGQDEALEGDYSEK